MKDDGTAGLIWGGIKGDVVAARSDAYNSKAKRAFYLTLYSEYMVTDHFTVSGSMYAKQGAAWPVDVIVIKGRGKSSRSLPAVDVPRIINDYVELGKELKNEQSSSNSQSVGILAEQGEGKPAKPSPNGAAVGGGGNGGITPNGGLGASANLLATLSELTPLGIGRMKALFLYQTSEELMQDDTEQSPHGLVRADTKEERHPARFITSRLHRPIILARWFPEHGDGDQGGAGSTQTAHRQH